MIEIELKFSLCDYWIECKSYKMGTSWIDSGRFGAKAHKFIDFTTIHNGKIVHSWTTILKNKNKNA